MPSPNRKEVLARMIQEKRDAKKASSTKASVPQASFKEKQKLQQMIAARKKQNSSQPPLPPNASTQPEATDNVSFSILQSDASLPPPPPSFRKSSSVKKTKVAANRSYQLNTSAAGTKPGGTRPSTPQTVKNIKAQQFSNSELRFKPKIRSLPSGIYGGSTPGKNASLSHLSFEERCSRAVIERDAKLYEKRAQKHENELNGCTFNPAININSMRAARMAKKDTRSVSDRLYDERVHRAAKQAQMKKQQEAETERAFEQAHTFTPASTSRRPSSAIKKRDGTPVGSRYKQVGASPCQRRDAGKDARCTFTPKVKGVKGNMKSAKIYLKNDVFSRLNGNTSGVETKENANPVYNAADIDDENPRPVMTMQNYMASKQQQKNTRPMSAGRLMNGSAKKRVGERPASTGRARDGKTISNTQFHSFLARQNQTELKKQQKIDQLSKQENYTFKPHLNEKTLEETAEWKEGDFLKRMKKYQIKKNNHQTELEAKYNPNGMDPECRDRPNINEKTKQLAGGGRSVVDLSRGDYLKRESNKKMLQMKVQLEEKEAEKKHREEVAKIKGASRVSRKAESHLKIAKDPNNYLDRLQRDAKKKKDMIRRKQQEIEMEELAGCTFAPETSDCPSYIKRIARSMALTKVDRGSEITMAAKPDWR